MTTRPGKNVELLGSGNKVEEKNPPIVKCPKCSTVNLVELGVFEKNMGAPYKFNCRQCRVEIFIAMVLIANTDLVKLSRHMQLLIDATNEATSGHDSGLILPRN